MPTVSRRMGGRTARHVLRKTPIPVDERPAKPGQRSGRYQPLTEIEIQQVHHAVLDVLAEIGLANAIPSCIEKVVGAGGKLSSEGRLLFPRGLIEDIIAGAAKDIVLHGQDPRHDLPLSDGRFYFGTAGAAVHMVDVETRTYRDSTLADLYNAARIVDAMEHIHFFQRPLVPRDIEDPREMDFNTCYASIKGTTKHVGTSFVEPDHLEQAVDMLERVAAHLRSGCMSCTRGECAPGHAHFAAGCRAGWRYESCVACRCRGARSCRGPRRPCLRQSVKARAPGDLRAVAVCL